MEPKKYTYVDISGGINDGVGASEIADKEVVTLQNFFPFGRKLIRRDGTYRLSAAAHTHNITGIFNYDTEGADALTILGTLTGFATFDRTALAALPAENQLPLNSDDHLWSMFQYKNIGYAIRPNAGLRRFTATAHSAPGIEAPATGPTLAQGAAGVLTAADYYGVVTFLNRDTAAESNPSPASSAVTLASGRTIDWSAIPTSSSAQVSGRRLYRTLPDQQGVYLFVAQINDNTTTVYNDNVAIADLGDFASFDNAVPPGTLTLGDFFEERLFATDGVDILYSEQFLPESFAEDSVIRVYPDDGHPITAIRADGSRLIIGKRNKTHFITAAGSGFSLETLSDKHGIASHHSVKSTEGQLLWYGGESFYRSYGGGQPESIATVKIKNLLSRVNPARQAYAVSAVFPKYSWYITALSLDDATRNNTILCYNYKADAWSTFTFPDDAPAVFAEIFDSEGAQALYAALYDAHLYQFSRGNDDFGNAITAKFKTKAYRWGEAGLLHCIRRFFLLCTTVPATATFRLYKNRRAVAEKSRTGASIYDAGGGVAEWRAFNMSTLGNPGAEWQLEMEYTGTPSIEIEGWGFETLPIARRIKPR